MLAKRKILIIIAIVVMLALSAVPALAADESLPVCDALSVTVEFQRVDGEVANVSFEWTGYDAPSYELKIFYQDNLIYQEVVYGAGTLVPVSIFEFAGNGIDEYAFYVLAFDGAAACRSAVESFYLDSIYVPPVPEVGNGNGGDEFPMVGDLRPGGDNGGSSGPGPLMLGRAPIWHRSDLGPGGGDDGGSGPGWPGL